MEGCNVAPIEYRTYKRRYFMYTSVVLFNMLVEFGLLQYTSNANVVTIYYHVGHVAVDYTGLLYGITAALLFYPIGRCIDKFGLSATMVFATGLNASATGLKLIASRRDLFWLLMVGQTIQGPIKVYAMCIVPKLAMFWFKPNSMPLLMGVNLACNTIGDVISFIMPLAVFHKTETITEIGYGLRYINLVSTGAAFFLFAYTLLVMRERPRTPPSQAAENYQVKSNSGESLLVLLRNKNVIFFLIQNSLQLSVYKGLTYTLNHALEKEFANGNFIVTIAGVLFSIGGIPGSIIFGLILKRWPKYKAFLITMTFVFIVFLALFVVGLYLTDEYVTCVALFGVGLLNFGICSFSMDFLIELCFPFPVGLLFALVMLTGNLPTIIATPIITLLIENYGSVVASYFLLAMMFGSVFAAVFITEDLRRQRANEEQNAINNNELLIT